LSLEADAGRDECAGAPRPEAEPPRDVANCVIGWVPTPNGREDLGDDPTDTRRGALPDDEEDIDVIHQLPVPPEVVIDVRAEGAVSGRRLLLRFPSPAVRSVGQRIAMGSPGFDPVRRRDLLAVGSPLYGKPSRSEQPIRNSFVA
jgi:hypothetical protein